MQLRRRRCLLLILSAMHQHHPWAPLSSSCGSGCWGCHLCRARTRTLFHLLPLLLNIKTEPWRGTSFSQRSSQIRLPRHPRDSHHNFNMMIRFSSAPLHLVSGDSSRNKFPLHSGCHLLPTSNRGAKWGIGSEQENFLKGLELLH